MMEFFTAGNLLTLFMLIILQAVLGFDNLLYISLESKKAPIAKQSYVRKMGIGIAIALRIILLFVLMNVIHFFQNPIFGINIKGIIQSNFNIHSILVLIGGIFILYTAIKEIFHMISHVEGEDEAVTGKASTGKVITTIVIMNLVFSFDSILSAMALTKNKGGFWSEMTLMMIAILISGVLMIWLADKVSEFLKKNRLYEVLGLFILLVVGIMLITDGGHLAHLTLFGHEITPMNEATFYFVIFILIAIDLVQSKYQKNLLAKYDSDSHQN